MENLTEKEMLLADTIKKQFQNQRVFDDIKCQLYAKLVQIMRGSDQSEEKRADNDSPQMQLLNLLIMEFLQWHQLNYTAEMLAMETGMSYHSPDRVLLESALGDFQFKDLPILLEIVLGLCEKKGVVGGQV